MGTPETPSDIREALERHAPGEADDILGPTTADLQERIAGLDLNLRHVNGVCEVLEAQIDELLRLLTSVGPQIRDYLARELDEHATAAENAMAGLAANGRPANPALVERAATLRLWQSLIAGKQFTPNLPPWAVERIKAAQENRPPDAGAMVRALTMGPAKA